MRAPTSVVALVALLTLAGCSAGGSPAAAPTSTVRPPSTATSSTASPTTTTVAASATTTAATTPPAAPVATSPGPTCGVDLASPTITAAVPRLRPAFADRPDVAWDPTPQGGNYDPCATLSAALVYIEGATGSSPEQLLMFHEGVYQGTGTLQAYGFTTVDVAASSSDTVVVHYGYEKPGETTASASGRVTVRYQWSGGAVRMLDTLPAEVTG